MKLGKAIKEIRVKKGVKQNDFAQICSITQSYLSNIESDRKEPTISILKEISKNLGVPLHIIFLFAVEDSDIPTDKTPEFKVVMNIIEKLLIEFSI